MPKDEMTPVESEKAREGPRKGTMTLLEAAKTVRDHNPHLRCICDFDAWIPEKTGHVRECPLHQLAVALKRSFDDSKPFTPNSNS